MQRAVDSREAHTVRRAGAVLAATTIESARGTPSAPEGFVGLAPQGEAHECTLVILHSARSSPRLRARHAREPTASEHALWQALRSSQLGVGFRRQALVAGYIVDFLGPSRRLVVEVDGGYHRSPAQRRADARRDRRLQRAGYRVLRLTAELVLGNLHAAIGCIRTAL